MTSDEITMFAHLGHISPEIERSLRPIIRQKDELAGYSEQINSANAKINAVFEDQKRLRENLKALKGSAEERALVQRYSAELNREEDELATLRRNVADLQGKREIAQQKLDEMITNVEMEVKI
jgi:predicted  nucleic acid-binding Zn-ribbon protein